MDINNEFKKLSFNNEDIKIYEYIIKKKLLSFLIYLYMYFIKLLRPF